MSAPEFSYAPRPDDWPEHRCVLCSGAPFREADGVMYFRCGQARVIERADREMEPEEMQKMFSEGAPRPVGKPHTRRPFKKPEVAYCDICGEAFDPRKTRGPLATTCCVAHRREREKICQANVRKGLGYVFIAEVRG